MIDVKTNSKHCFLLTFISIFLTADAMKMQLFNTPSGGAHQEKKVNRSGRESKKLQQSLQVSVLLHLTLPYLTFNLIQKHFSVRYGSLEGEVILGLYPWS